MGNRPVEEIVASGRRVLTVPELAHVVAMNPTTIRLDIRSGRLKAAQGGHRGEYRISFNDAEAWWQSRGGNCLFGGLAGVITSSENNESPLRSALKVLDELGPRIAAGTLAPVDSVSEIREARESRDS